MSGKAEKTDMSLLNLRRRGKRWLPDETGVLIHAISERQAILSAKHESYSGTNRSRLRAWNDIVDLLNRSFNRGRTILQCFNKQRDFTSKAKMKYADLLEKYGRTGAAGINRARDEMSQLELVAIEIKGLISVEGLDLEPSVTGQELMDDTSSTYIRPRSISNQVVESDNYESDASGDERIDDVERAPCLDDEPPVRHRFKPIGRPKKTKEAIPAPQLDHDGTDEIADVTTKRKKQTKMDDIQMRTMTFPPKKRERSMSPGANSVRANNVLLTKLLDNQKKIMGDIRELKRDMRVMRDVIDKPLRATSSIQRPLESTPISYEKSDLSDSSTYERYQEGFSIMAGDRSDDMPAPLNLTKKKTNKSGSDTESLDLEDINDPMIEVPTFGKQNEDEANLLEEMYPKETFIVPEPPVESVPKVTRKRSLERPADKENENTAVVSQVEKKRNYGKGSKKKSTPPKENTSSDVSEVKKTSPKVTHPKPKGTGVKKGSKKSGELTTDLDEPPIKRNFSIRQLHSLVNDLLDSMDEKDWDKAVELSKCRRKIFQEYDNKASNIFIDLNDSEETDLCHLIMNRVPVKLSMIGQSRVMVVLISKLVDKGYPAKFDEESPDVVAKANEGCKAILDKYLAKRKSSQNEEGKEKDSHEDDNNNTVDESPHSDSTNLKRYPSRSGHK